MRQLVFLVILAFNPVNVFSASEEILLLSESIKGLRELQNSEDLEWRQMRGRKLYLDMLSLESVYRKNPLYHASLASAAELSGKKGETILHLHRALSLAPFRKDLADAAWRQEREWKKNNPDSLSGHPGQGYHGGRFLARWAGLSLSLVAVAAGIALLVFGLKNRFQTRRIFGFSLVLLILILISFSLLILPFLHSKAIILDSVDMLKYDNETAGIVSVLPEGSCVTTLRKRSGWLYVKAPDGSEGWIPQNTAGFVENF